MLGAIIGDIAGSRWEGCPTNDYRFELFSEQNRFTDDTVCTAAVADALLKGRDYGESLHEWCRRYPHRGYGGRFRQWIASEDPRPYDSFGNGSAMRVSPVGWWFDDPGETAEQARLSAACTHNHPEGIRGAQAAALAVRDCRKMREAAADKDKTFTPDDILRLGVGRAAALYCGKPENFSIDLEACRNRFDVTCQGTVPVALWIVMHSVSFEDAVRRAVSLGADADTLGAVVGGIAEALWGIPEWMEEKALGYLTDEIKTVVDEFRRRLRQPR